MKEKYRKDLGWLLAVILILPLAILHPITNAMAATSVSVGSWQQLREAITNNTDVEITLTSDLAADSTITVPAGKTVTLLGDKTIYRKDGAKPFLSMLNVQPGGTLNLGNGSSCVDMSGKTIRTQPVVEDEYEILPAKEIKNLDPVADADRRFLMIRPEANDTRIFTFTDSGIGQFNYGAAIGDSETGILLSPDEFPQLEDALLQAGARPLDGSDGNTFFNPKHNKYFGLNRADNFRGVVENFPDVMADKFGVDYFFYHQMYENQWHIKDVEELNKNVNYREDGYLWGEQWYLISSRAALVQLREVQVREIQKDELVQAGTEQEHRYSAAELGLNLTDGLDKGGFFIDNRGGAVNISCGNFSDFKTSALPAPTPWGVADQNTDWLVAPGTIAPIYNEGVTATFTMTGGAIKNNEVGLNDRVFNEGAQSVSDYNGDGLVTFDEVKQKAIANGDAKAVFQAMDFSNGRYNFGTRSAGAIILNDGASGTLTNAQILSNKGDAGAIIVNKSNLVINDGTKIDANEGLYLGGAININSVEAKGVTMNGGEISNNKSVRNGAITVLGPAGVTGGVFTLNNGDIFGNYTLDKGGAIRVGSNGVNLKSGNFYENKAWIMGGAIYVNGDSPQNSRTLVLNQGSIYDNHAVGKNDSLLDGATDDSRVSMFRAGSGGGVWVCPFGTFVFNASRVIIDDNTAFDAGQDFFKETGVNGEMIAQNLTATWVNETNGPIPDVTPVSEKLALTNSSTGARASGGVNFYDNVSRRGGAIGADGTLVFGEQTDIKREHVSLEFTKTFAPGTPVPTEIYVQLTARATDGYVTDLGFFKLSNADVATVTEGGVSAADVTDPTGTVTALGNWRFRIEVPANIPTSSGEEPLLPENIATGTVIPKSEFKIQMEEVSANGAPQSEYLFNLGDVTVAEHISQTQSSVTTDTSGKEYTTTVTFAETKLTQTGTNEQAPSSAPEPVSLVLQAGKEVLATDGSDVTQANRNMFAFKIEEKLSDGTLKLVSSAKNLVDGRGDRVKFPEITYKEAGEHTYVISEIPGTNPLMNYDKSQFEVKVVVTPDETNALQTAVTINDSPIGEVVGTFRNKLIEPNPELEKYVNKDVHSDLSAFDTEFTYDLMAFVTPDADKVVIEDTLVDSLKFISAPADVKVAAMGNANNHIDTVKSDGVVIDSAKAVATIVGQKLTVTIADATEYRGQWVKVTFKAVINTENHTSLDSFGTDWTEITANSPVLIDKSHEGVKNTASYRIFVKDSSGDYPTYGAGEDPNDPNGAGGGEKPRYEEDSNTVTVNPPTEELTVSKVWVNADGSATWPADVAEVVVDVYSVKGDLEIKLEGKSVTLNAQQTSATITGLPVLTDVTYVAKEAGVTDAGTVTLGGNTYKVIVAGGEVTNTILPEEPTDPINPNGDEPGGNLEKYVNKGVHSELEFFDKSFEYDIMAFVPEDADKVVIEDTLVESLLFVSTQDEVSAFAMGTNNNHETTVASEGELITSVEAVISGKKLMVTIPDATEYRGQWVRVNFKAVIDVSNKNTLDSLKADTATIQDNSPVLIAEEHTGVKNDANYKVFVKKQDGTFPQYSDGENPDNPSGGGDKPKYQDESNTVTVTPPTENLEVAKHWVNADASTTWPADVAEVVVDVYSVKGGLETKLEGKSVTLTANSSSVTIANLPKLEGVTYIVKEAGVAADNTVTFGGNIYVVTVDGVNITNTFEREVPPDPDPNNPGGEDPNNPGGDNPGGEDPNNPGGEDPNNPGGDNPGGEDPNNPGGEDPNNPGGEDPNNPGDNDPNNPGGDEPNGDNPKGKGNKGRLAKTGSTALGFGIVGSLVLAAGLSLVAMRKRKG